MTFGDYVVSFCYESYDKCDSHAAPALDLTPGIANQDLTARHLPITLPLNLLFIFHPIENMFCIRNDDKKRKNDYDYHEQLCNFAHRYAFMRKCMYFILCNYSHLCGTCIGSFDKLYHLR